MDTIDWAQMLTKIVAGGPAFWIAGGVALILFVFFFLKLKKMESEAAQNQSNTQKNSDQAATLHVNQDASKKWDEASSEVDEVRKKFREALKKSPTDSEK